MIAFTDAGYVIAGWAISLVVVAGYAASLVLRGRRLGGRVPARRRRWMHADD